MSDFLREQKIDIDNSGTVTLVNHYNTDEHDKKMYEERKEEQKGKELRKVCEIPEFEFYIDPLLKKYRMYCEAHDGVEARKAIRQFLALNPQYLATDKKF